MEKNGTSKPYGVAASEFILSRSHRSSLGNRVDSMAWSVWPLDIARPRSSFPHPTLPTVTVHTDR